jgi:hypothetical protein
MPVGPCEVAGDQRVHPGPGADVEYGVPAFDDFGVEGVADPGERFLDGAREGSGVLGWIADQRAGGGPDREMEVRAGVVGHGGIHVLHRRDDLFP